MGAPYLFVALVARVLFLDGDEACDFFQCEADVVPKIMDDAPHFLLGLFPKSESVGVGFGVLRYPAECRCPVENFAKQNSECHRSGNRRIGVCLWDWERWLWWWWW